MGSYIIRRLLIMPLILLGVTLLIFGMISFLGPNQRVAMYVRDLPRSDLQMDNLIKRYGLDQPFLVQYWTWLWGRHHETADT